MRKPTCLLILTLLMMVGACEDFVTYDAINRK